MYLFLISFITLYGGMHLYAFIKLKDALLIRKSQTWFLILWMIVMTFIPLLVRMAEQSGMEKAAETFAWPGYVWMGFLFIFSALVLFSDVVLHCLRFVTNQFHKTLPQAISSRNASRLALLFTLIASVYAFFEAGQIQSEHVVIVSPKLSPTISRIRIVQISDVHIGLLLRERRLGRILDIIREAQPDILVSTGDLIDGKLNRGDSIAELNPLALMLASVAAPYGKFAIIGNHEVYAGLPQALAFMRTAGFTTLRNQSKNLLCGLTISGIDDRAINPKALADSGSETALLNAVSADSFHLLLKHRPEILPGCDGHFDLQLSGHVHGGQIFPFNFLVRLKHPIPCGTTTTGAGSRIYVSRGTGTWGPPMRLLAPPEVTIIDIINQTDNAL